jgi:hypothetical protein
MLAHQCARSLLREGGEESVSTSIDWSRFDAFAENTCTCRCGQEFRSHSKVVMSNPPEIVTRRPCPACGMDRASRSSSDVERYTISRKA